MIISLTGASGTGKTTVAKAVMERLPNAQPLTSVTTRAPRPSDLPGDFLYVSPDEFAAMDARGDFLWKARVGETDYGTTRAALKNALAKPETIWMMILVPECVPLLCDFADAEGCRDQVRCVYLQSPSDDVLRQRLAERGDSPAQIEERLQACRVFQDRARASDVPYVFVEDTNQIQDKLNAVLTACGAIPAPRVQS